MFNEAVAKDTGKQLAKSLRKSVLNPKDPIQLNRMVKK